MINWNKRVTGFKENGLKQGEEVIGVAFMQPPGSLTEATGRASFGIIGAIVTSKMSASKKKADDLSSSKMSKEFPNAIVIVAVTSQDRIMVYEQAVLSGKPKKLIKTYQKGDMWVDSIKKGLLKSDMVLAFKDGGLRSFELGKGQDYKSFEKSLV